MTINNFLAHKYDLSRASVGHYIRGRWIEARQGKPEQLIQAAMLLMDKDVSPVYRDKNGVDLSQGQFMAALGWTRRKKIISKIVRQ